ncbi:MAG: DUF370 domain-containing protein [Oscillospiraceae bacterium]|nr:DUF370 domain-containing protein [Oscillospiraceae bacterium]
MYLYLGGNIIIHEQDIVGIFDLDNTSESKWTRRLLSEADREGRIVSSADELPRSFVLSRTGLVYLSVLSTETLRQRVGAVV